MRAASEALDRLHVCAVCIAIGLLILRAWIAGSHQYGPMHTSTKRILNR